MQCWREDSPYTIYSQSEQPKCQHNQSGSQFHSPSGLSTVGDIEAMRIHPISLEVCLRHKANVTARIVCFFRDLIRHIAHEESRMVTYVDAVWSVGSPDAGMSRLEIDLGRIVEDLEIIESLRICRVLVMRETAKRSRPGLGLPSKYEIPICTACVFS